MHLNVAGVMKASVADIEIIPKNVQQQDQRENGTPADFFVFEKQEEKGREKHCKQEYGIDIPEGAERRPDAQQKNLPDHVLKRPFISLKDRLDNINYLPQKIRNQQGLYTGLHLAAQILKAEISEKKKPGDRKKPAHAEETGNAGD